MITWGPYIKRGLAIEVGEDGHVTLAIRSPYARFVFDAVRQGSMRGKGRRLSTWWYLNPDLSPSSRNFEPGHAEVKELVEALLAVLEGIEKDGKKYMEQYHSKNTGSLRLRIAELELEVAQLKLEVEG